MQQKTTTKEVKSKPPVWLGITVPAAGGLIMLGTVLIDEALETLLRGSSHVGRSAPAAHAVERERSVCDCKL